MLKKIFLKTRPFNFLKDKLFIFSIIQIKIFNNKTKKRYKMYKFFNNRVIVKVGDITEEDTEAIVNAANSSLMGGGGVDGAIHRKGGAKILEECKRIRKKYIGGLPTGEAVITTGGNLKAKYVIHTVGPIFLSDPDPDNNLIKCYYHCLKIARENNIKSIAFPSISTGVYGFPKERAAKLVSSFIENYVKNYDKPETIKLVFFSEKDLKIFLENIDWEK